MPQISTNGTGPRVATNFSLISRDGLRRRRAEEQSEQQRQQRVDALGTRLKWNRDRVVQASIDRRNATIEYERELETEKDLLAEDMRLQRAGASETIRAIITPVTWVAALLIDVCLLGGASSFLVSMIYQSESGTPWWSMFAAAPLLLALDIGVSYKLAFPPARPAHLDPAQPQPFNRWVILAGMLAVAIPGMAVSAVLTAMSAQGIELSLSTIAILGAVLTLGGACHVYILYSGLQGHEALTYLVHRVHLIFLRRSARAAEARQRGAHDRAVAGWTGYNAARAAYQAEAPVPGHLDFSSLERKLVNDAVGEEVIRAPEVAGGARENPEDPPTRKTSESAGSGDAPAPPTTLTPAGGADPDSTGGNGESFDAPSDPRNSSGNQDSSELSDETAYLRRLIEARRMDTDGEVRAR